jgi:hypothetical protein
MYNVVVQARGVGGSAGQSTIDVIVAGVPTFKWSVFTQNGITIGPAAGLSDGYGSQTGLYVNTAADSTGSLATNGSVNLTSATVVKGDVSAVGTITGSAGVTGTVTPGLASPFPAMPVLPCPTGGYTEAFNVPGGAGITYVEGTGTLTVSGGGNLTLPVSQTQYYFRSVTLSGNSKLTINGGGSHVDIWIDDALNLTGGDIVNASLKPTGLGLWSCGSGSSAMWILRGGNGAYYSIYAPNHPLTLNGSGDLWGSVVGASVTATGGAKIHYDAALSRRTSTSLVTLAGTWAQFPQ